MNPIKSTVTTHHSRQTRIARAAGISKTLPLSKTASTRKARQTATTADAIVTKTDNIREKTLNKHSVPRTRANSSVGNSVRALPASGRRGTMPNSHAYKAALATGATRIKTVVKPALNARLPAEGNNKIANSQPVSTVVGAVSSEAAKTASDVPPVGQKKIKENESVIAKVEQIAGATSAAVIATPVLTTPAMRLAAEADNKNEIARSQSFAQAEAVKTVSNPSATEEKEKKVGIERSQSFSARTTQSSVRGRAATTDISDLIQRGFKKAAAQFSKKKENMLKMFKEPDPSKTGSRIRSSSRDVAGRDRAHSAMSAKIQGDLHDKIAKDAISKIEAWEQQLAKSSEDFVKIGEDFNKTRASWHKTFLQKEEVQKRCKQIEHTLHNKISTYASAKKSQVVMESFSAFLKSIDSPELLNFCKALDDLRASSTTMSFIFDTFIKSESEQEILIQNKSELVEKLRPLINAGDNDADNKNRFIEAIKTVYNTVQHDLSAQYRDFQNTPAFKEILKKMGVV